MKMKFSIGYKTHWGESMQLELTFAAADGYQDTMSLPLTTQDGYNWTVETATRQNRHHPYVAIAYYYMVKDGEGRVKRRESLLADREYIYNDSHNYLFNDTWLDDENEGKANYFANITKKEALAVNPSHMPLFERTIIFKVHAPNLFEGEAVALLGNHPTLGNWNTEHFLPMNPSKDQCWELSVNVQAIDAPIEYKYVVIDEETHQFKRWEFGENRTLGNLRIYNQDVCILHGGNFRVKKMPPHAQFNFDTYIFDLDGTLLSTLQDLASSCNYALKTNGMPERTIEEVRMFVGNGVKKLMERAIPGGLKNKKFEKTYQDFRKHYMIHNLDTTQPYPDVMEMLEELKNRGKNIAVVSNKFYAATQELCRHFFGNLVDVAIGEREDIKKKPAPDTVNEALRQLHADRKRAVYIGDSDVDVMTARNSGMPCISVLWGFRDQEFLIAHDAMIFVSSPLQIL